DLESFSGGCKGIVIREATKVSSNWRNNEELSCFLEKKGITGLSGIDTRKLTRILREQGSQPAVISLKNYSEKKIKSLFDSFGDLKGKDLAQKVTCSENYLWRDGSCNTKVDLQKKFKVVAYDFGIKHNILRLLVDRGCEVNVVTAKTSAEEVLKMNPDGIFLSNGPGDPEPCDYAIKAIKKILEMKLPVFGICLGHQLLGLALGLETEKMKFGHHGANHPVKDLKSNEVFITSQNHGFTISENSIKNNNNVEVTHRSLFDNSIQGISYADGRVFSFQGHPEASPGPQDIQSLFDKFIKNMSG
ncbi:glutamine-hydrolyzing carbamoyl-phosphate synthase small subunit, partial [SAR86 cluster bacterium]|nr:glutamine-hydrolyzing carbamoyl-phosphate synthase small subunit [SAR86 cluster bacterium]